MQRLKITPNNLAQVVETAVATLQQGGLILFPTETTYGAGVLATHPDAVQKLLKYKSRREGKPLSIAVTDLAMAQQYADVNDQAKTLYQRYLPGPVTVVSKDLGNLAPGVASEFGTIGVRIPAYPLAIEIVKKLGLPITATSANASGEKRPYTIEDVLDNLSTTQADLLDLVIDAGQLPENPPSTVIDTTLSAPVVFRQGEIALTQGNATELHSLSAEETRQLAGKLVLKYWNNIKETGVIFALNGSLGVGKTEFTKGIAEFLQISETLTSPTYTYVESYDFLRHTVAGQLHHWDWWRIGSLDELHRLEPLSTIGQNQVTVIEWATQVAGGMELLQTAGAPIITVNFSEAAGPNERTLTVIEGYSG